MDNAEVVDPETVDKTSTSAAASTPEAATFDARELVSITHNLPVDENVYVKHRRLALKVPQRSRMPLSSYWTNFSIGR